MSQTWSSPQADQITWVSLSILSLVTGGLTFVFKENIESKAKLFSTSDTRTKWLKSHMLAAFKSLCFLSSIISEKATDTMSGVLSFL